MKRQSILIGLVALMTLGGGLINLSSVIGPSLPHRMAMLRQLFPLEFLRLSRFLTLLIGFALVVSSINIYKRKRRAFQIVFTLGCLSILFQLTKGLDYEEALFSAVLLGLLIFTRKHFSVKSSIPNVRLGFLRFGIALIVGLSYGVAGFWFLDRREFGIDFTLGDAIHRTLLFFSLVGDPEVVPHTRYARWFLNSLYLMTVTTIGYALFALFRPVIYQFRTLPHERAHAMELVSRYGRSALDYFKCWPDKSYFFSPSRHSFIAYGVAGNFAVGLGNPVGPEEALEGILRQFKTFCDENDWRLAFLQSPPDLLPIYKALGFKKLKIGDEAIVDVTQFTLVGKAMKEFRHIVNQMEKSGVHTVSYEPPIPDDLLQQAKEVSDEWLQIPGRRERGFTLGLFEPNYIRSTPLFVATDANGKILAFLNLIPSYHPGEATIDLMRRRTEAPNGIMDYLFVKLFLECKAKGFERFSLGHAPLAGFQEREGASPEERAVHYFFEHLNFLFSFTGLRQYKAKFATSWEPRYVIYQNVLDLPRLAVAIMELTDVKQDRKLGRLFRIPREMLKWSDRKSG